MKTNVRFVACCAGFLLLVPCIAQGSGPSEAWPNKPIRFIVPFPPAGGADITARLMGQKLSEFLGQPVIVDNRSGAGGNIGAAVAAKSAPDGYTVLMSTTAFVVNASLYLNPGYDAERDFIPTVVVARQPIVIVVNTSVPAKTLAGLLRLAESWKFAFATPGNGTMGDLTGKYLFNVLAKLQLTPVQFRGASPALAGVLAGEPSVGSMALASPLPHIATGRLRALAVSSSKRVAALPDVPTLVESGFPSLQVYNWNAIFLRAGTSPAIVQRLNESANGAIQSAGVQERLRASAFEPVGGSWQQAAVFVSAEIVKWRKVVRDTAAKPD